jgi:hypothetical protein
MTYEDVIMDSIVKSGGLYVNGIDNEIRPTDLKHVFEKATEAWEAFEDAVNKYCSR